MLSHFGIKKKEEKTIKTPKKCSICKILNAYESTRCSQCSKPLDLQTALEIEEESKTEIQIIRDEQARMNQMMENIQKELLNSKGNNQ